MPPDETDFRLKMEKRMAMLDGNGIDAAGGRVGRLESTVSKVLWLAVTTLLTTWGTLAWALVKRP